MNPIIISILNYNNAQATIRCLKSILMQTYSKIQILVVDNCSNDDSVAQIMGYISELGLNSIILSEEALPGDYLVIPGQIVIVKARNNGGYASGNNIAIRAARIFCYSGQILLLNNDIELPPDFLDRAIESYNQYCKEFKTTKIVIGSPEVSMTGQKRHGGFVYLNLPTGLTFPFPHLFGMRYIVGSCILLPLDAPFMDDSYFLYYDDASYSIILKNNGFILLSCNNTWVKHEMGGTTGQSKELEIIIFRSMKLFYMSNYPYLYPVVVLFRIVLALLSGRLRLARTIVISAFKPIK